MGIEVSLKHFRVHVNRKKNVFFFMLFNFLEILNTTVNIEFKAANNGRSSDNCPLKFRL